MRYDAATGLYWMSVRAYDPTLGRFLQRDPLGRTPLIWADQPYVYAGNNPLINVDPSGQMVYFGRSADVQNRVVHATARHMARVYARAGSSAYLKRELAKANRISNDLSEISLLTAAIGVLQLGKSVYQLFQDLELPAGLDKTLNLVGDFINVINGLITAAIGVVAVLQRLGADVAGVLHALHVAAEVASFIASAYSAFRTASGWFINIAKGIFYVALAAFKVGFDDLNIVGLVLSIGAVLLTRIERKWQPTFAFDAVVYLLQGLINNRLADIDEAGKS